MTAATAELCGHRWRRGVGRAGRAARRADHPDHRCDEPATHAVHRCRCGATTTKEPR